LQPPDNVTELVARASQGAAALVDARVRAYRTPVTLDTLRSPVE
jgi:hypothetical protein